MILILAQRLFKRATLRPAAGGHSNLRSRFVRALLASISLSLFSASADANHTVIVETVEDYSVCNGPPLFHAHDSGYSFGTELHARTAGTAGYAAATHYIDSAVWTTDFYDPEKTTPSDDDDTYFDNRYRAISYFQGHGSTDNNFALTSQYCTQDAQCTSPPVGGTCFAGGSAAALPGFCARHPGYNYGHCDYTCKGKSLAIGNCTQGPPRGGLVSYGYPAGYVKLGESNHAGTWGGAGTNGGTNAAVFWSSAASLANRPQEVWGAMAGLQLFLLVADLDGSDTADSSQIGLMFGTQSGAPGTAVADSWRWSINSISELNTPCTGPGGLSWTGKGINGCGYVQSIASGSTFAVAQARLNLNWYDIRRNLNDASSGAHFAIRYTCNYDCNTWTFNMP